MQNEHRRKPKSDDEDQFMSEILTLLNSMEVEAVKQTIKDHSQFIAKSFEDVRPSTVSITHRFELESENRIDQKERKTSPSHNETVNKKVARMLSAGIITPIEL